MKKSIVMIILILITVIVYYNRESLAKVFLNFVKENKVISEVTNNEYSKDKSYNYVKLTNDFIVNDKKDILNVIYTVLNSGMSDFTFYCDDSYVECMNDIDVISKDRVILSNINNFVHPFNSFSDVETTRYPSTGKVIVNINRQYETKRINLINNKVKEIINENVTSDMDDKDKIKVIHDYIINTTKYDNLKSDENISNYSSDTAYGPLFEGYAICNGYSDLMGIFLYEMDIESFKIASENHIWNLVKLDNSWYHLDLTWDDPVMENGKEIIDYNYYLITTDELMEFDDNQHYFDKEVYKDV